MYHISYTDRLCTTELADLIDITRMHNNIPVQVIQKRHKEYENKNLETNFIIPLVAAAWPGGKREKLVIYIPI